jgi:hypothetical protein
MSDECQTCHNELSECSWCGDFTCEDCILTCDTCNADVCRMCVGENHDHEEDEDATTD